MISKSIIAGASAFALWNLGLVSQLGTIQQQIVCKILVLSYGIYASYLYSVFIFVQLEATPLSNSLISSKNIPDYVFSQWA
jgi:hypothetical protein